jgi:hypothetical protein
VILIHPATTTLEQENRDKRFNRVSSPPTTMTSAFFYGILMHPKILKRVLHNDASHLQICPAILIVSPFLLNGMHCVWLLIRPIKL